MKTLILIVFILSTQILKFESTEINTKASFNGFHCDGKPGLCSIDNSNNRATANTTLQIQANKTLLLKIKRNMLSDTEVKNIFKINRLDLNTSKSYLFNVPETITIKSSVSKLLDRSLDYIAISKGNHPITISDKYFTITFHIKE